ncbi:MAG: 16S rRNA (uracil(1498)-N(3))-methyltransferase [Vicinamibacteria bacterium]
MGPPRFHVPGAAPGARLRLPDHVAHHARDVLRLRAGASVHVFDGEGAEYEAVLESVDRRATVAHLRGAVPALPEPALALTLALSPLKGDLMELVIQKATELGVAELRPVVCGRTDAAARPALRGTRQERWEKVASGAAEQCGRARVPRIAPAGTLVELLGEAFDGPRLLLQEPGAERPPLGALPHPGARLLLLVGPAGGFEPVEIARAAAAGFQAVRLGPRVLRSETAAVAALAAAQALWGDLR